MVKMRKEMVTKMVGGGGESESCSKRESQIHEAALASDRVIDCGGVIDANRGAEGEPGCAT